MVNELYLYSNMVTKIKQYAEVDLDDNVFKGSEGISMHSYRSFSKNKVISKVQKLKNNIKSHSTVL